MGSKCYLTKIIHDAALLVLIGCFSLGTGKGTIKEKFLGKAACYFRLKQFSCQLLFNITTLVSNACTVEGMN
jgi:hypothetical protein